MYLTMASDFGLFSCLQIAWEASKLANAEANSPDSGRKCRGCCARSPQRWGCRPAAPPAGPPLAARDGFPVAAAAVEDAGPLVGDVGGDAVFPFGHGEGGGFVQGLQRGG